MNRFFEGSMKNESLICIYNAGLFSLLIIVLKNDQKISHLKFVFLFISNFTQMLISKSLYCCWFLCRQFLGNCHNYYCSQISQLQISLYFPTGLNKLLANTNILAYITQQHEQLVSKQQCSKNTNKIFPMVTSEIHFTLYSHHNILPEASILYSLLF